MKVAITGHTKGIGKAIAELYPDHIGFSRSTGFDITNPMQRSIIYGEASECDVFINNAWQDDCQTLMFTDMFELWSQDESKTIVNINSRAKYMTGTDNFYYNSKIELADESNKHMLGRKCRIININPGYVMTDFAKDIIDEQYAPYMTAEQVAEYVKWAIDQPFEIYELSLWKLGP